MSCTDTAQFFTLASIIADATATAANHREPANAAVAVHDDNTDDDDFADFQTAEAPSPRTVTLLSTTAASSTAATTASNNAVYGTSDNSSSTQQQSQSSTGWDWGTLFDSSSSSSNANSTSISSSGNAAASHQRNIGIRTSFTGKLTQLLAALASCIVSEVSILLLYRLIRMDHIINAYLLKSALCLLVLLISNCVCNRE
jgi:hypothetical protein